MLILFKCLQKYILNSLPLKKVSYTVIYLKQWQQIHSTFKSVFMFFDLGNVKTIISSECHHNKSINGKFPEYLPCKPVNNNNLLVMKYFHENANR